MSETQKELASSVNTLSFQNVISYSGCLIIYLRYVHQVSTEQIVPLSPLSIAFYQYPHFLHRCPASPCLWTSYHWWWPLITKQVFANPSPREVLSICFPYISTLLIVEWRKRPPTVALECLEDLFSSQKHSLPVLPILKIQKWLHLLCGLHQTIRNCCSMPLVSHTLFVFTASHLSSK